MLLSLSLSKLLLIWVITENPKRNTFDTVFICNHQMHFLSSKYTKKCICSCVQSRTDWKAPHRPLSPAGFNGTVSWWRKKSAKQKKNKTRQADGRKAIKKGKKTPNELRCLITALPSLAKKQPFLPIIDPLIWYSNLQLLKMICRQVFSLEKKVQPLSVNGEDGLSIQTFITHIVPKA